MVCQGASQSRFQALKHEHGIAGKPTIKVRVIAYFQPLQDCQVFVFSLMVELSSSWLYQCHPPLESSAFTSCMIAPVEHRQHESLPASINPSEVSANLGSNGFGFSGLTERGFTFEGSGSLQNSSPHFQSPLNQYQCCEGNISHFPARACEKPLTCEPSSAQQKNFLIFDQSGDETRLIFSSLCPLNTCPAWNLPKNSFGAYHRNLAQKQGKIPEQAWTKTPALCEESGENEIIDDVSEMREDTEEINALLYSEDDDDCGGCDDEEVSSGHSPLAKEIKDCKQQEEEEDEKDSDNEVASLERPSKRQKALHGVHNRVWQSPVYEDFNDGDYIGSLNEGVCVGPTSGSKRPRKDKIHDTLRVLESIIPGNPKSKDPLVILDEAIGYLKSLKYNAKTMSLDDEDSSGCYESSN